MGEKTSNKRNIPIFEELRDLYSELFESFEADIADDIMIDQLLKDCGALVRLKEKARKLLDK